MERIEKGRALILCALLCTVIIAILGIKDAKNINAEMPEDTANKQVKEITIVTLTPKKVEAQEYIDFDLRNLSIVRKEGEEDVVNNRGSREPTSVTEDSGRDESGTQGYSDDNSGDEYSVGEAVGSEMAESGQGQWSEPEDIVSEDGDGEPMPELADAETSNEAGTEGSVDEYAGLSEDGYSDGYADESDTGEELTYLGNYTLTFYCPCADCCTVETGITASGTTATEWHTVASGQFDFGTKLYIDGLGYFIVEDRGVEGNVLDVFVNDHQHALDLGVQYRDVYLVN